MGLTHFPHGILATPNLGAGSGAYGPEPELFGGSTYYVDYEHGFDSNPGTIDEPVKQVNQAIALSNSERLAESKLSATDGALRRNRIFIKPFSTGASSTLYAGGTMGQYDPISTIPQHCDIIGTGQGVRSNGAGIVAIGSSTTSTTAMTIGSDGMRGVNWYNIQFRGGGTTTATVTCTGTVMRCGFYGCSFYSLPSTTALISATGHWAGNIMYRNLFAHNETSPCATYCFYFTTGVFTDNWFEENTFAWGSTALVSIGATSLSHGTVFYHNFFVSNGGTTDSFIDASVDGGAFLAENYFAGASSDALHRVVSNYDAGNIQGATLITD